MIICTAWSGICLLAGGISHHEQSFRLEGTNSAWRRWWRWRGCRWCCPPSPPVRPKAPTPCRSWCSWRPRRWRCGRCSCSCRRCGTATTSCRRGTRLTRTCMPPRPPWPRRGQLRAAAGGLVWWCGLAKQLSPSHRGGPGGSGRPEGGGRHRHRHAGAAARDLGRHARRPRQPAADQHEPGPGLGPGQHRPDHPRVVVSSRRE
jgi:hypothetical protein